jgi:hypothetical protein
MSSQNYSGSKFSGQNSNELFPAGVQAHLLKRSNNIEKKSDPANPAKFNTEEFRKIKKSDSDDAKQEAST